MGETISDAIGTDHSSFDVYVENLKSAQDDAEKVRWRNQLTWTLARHAISEELTLYPAMEKYLGQEGVKLAKTDKEQHVGVGPLHFYCKHDSTLVNKIGLSRNIGQELSI